jgi:AraC-like DNA-binding protein
MSAGVMPDLVPPGFPGATYLRRVGSMTGTPAGMLRRPGADDETARRTHRRPVEVRVGADPLSDVLHHVRLSGAVFFHVEASSPWVVEAPRACDIAAACLPAAQHVIEYHVVTHGECFGGVVGEAPVALRAGDVIAFPQGDAQVISSAPGMRAPHDVTEYARLLRGPRPMRLTLGAGGPADVELLCGFLGCDARPFNPLLATLPRVLHARVQPDDASSALAAFIAAAAQEVRARRPGSDTVLARLSELMFVDVVRRHVESLPEGGTGWLSGLRDAHVGRALALLHGEPRRGWTMDDLARGAALSRSALAERFTKLVGEPPMQYLTRWRMQLAAAALAARSSAGVAEVAAEVGYASQAAFSRAFKKLVGVPPAAWRRERSPRPRELNRGPDG